MVSRAPSPEILPEEAGGVLRKRFTLGQGLRRQRLVVAEAFVRGRGKEDRETQMTTVCWAKRAKGNQRASPKARESPSAPRPTLHGHTYTPRTTRTGHDPTAHTSLTLTPPPPAARTLHTHLPWTPAPRPLTQPHHLAEPQPPTGHAQQALRHPLTPKLRGDARPIRDGGRGSPPHSPQPPTRRPAPSPAFGSQAAAPAGPPPPRPRRCPRGPPRPRRPVPAPPRRPRGGDARPPPLRASPPSARPRRWKGERHGARNKRVGVGKSRPSRRGSGRSARAPAAPRLRAPAPGPAAAPARPLAPADRALPGPPRRPRVRAMRR
ncbi:proline-rich protein 2-like [Hippopotamus amphibius kiboko]|uniref:proline-rich protein 2-like n=1 Tax=Hippopotamus amphibius kiboko TaxID=575201 RepID=UPI002594396C|nr:proline-rich protein 2-like [Hippopotamus amphibius kiboko]